MMPRAACTIGVFSLMNCSPIQPLPLPISTAWSERTVVFSGRVWNLRESNSPVGAGPNYWSASPEAIYVDQKGLHLGLRQQAGTWYSAEVSTQVPRQDMRVSLELSGPLGNSDPNVIIAAFLYLNDKSELDFEFGRFGKRSGPNGQFVVAPPNPENMHTFELRAEENTAHLQLNWRTEKVTFQLSTVRSPKRLWSRGGSAVPNPSGHRLHVNIWLYQGRPPTNNMPASITISSLRIDSLLSPPLIGQIFNTQ